MIVDPSSSLQIPSGEVRYKFQWSDDYSNLQKKFEKMKNSGDANLLVIFLSQNPYHHEALLQLALVFARMGLIDRCADLIKRCLFYLDCVKLDSFKPYTGKARMDPTCRENAIYFQALFRYMQIADMQGMTHIASNISRLILSLDPEGDSRCILLRLDSQLLASGQYDILQNVLDSHAFPSVRSSLHLLPGWSFSKALLTYHRNGGNGRDVETMLALDTAVRRWPSVVSSILKRLDPSRESKNALSHTFISSNR
jgi:hypothetical protein